MIARASENGIDSLGVPAADVVEAMGEDIPAKKRGPYKTASAAGILLEISVTVP
jgi:hypothetical protein